MIAVIAIHRGIGPLMIQSARPAAKRRLQMIDPIVYQAPAVAWSQRTQKRRFFSAGFKQLTLGRC
jgi:hypothetical protein